VHFVGYLAVGQGSSPVYVTLFLLHFTFNLITRFFSFVVGQLGSVGLRFSIRVSVTV